MVLHTKRYSLTLDKNKCTGCGICMEICPREAIEVTKTPKIEGKEAKSPTVAISEEKCTYCGMCEALCPFGALSTKINGEHTTLFEKIMRWKHINQPSREKLREAITEIENYGSCEELKKLKKVVDSDLTFDSFTSKLFKLEWFK